MSRTEQVRIERIYNQKPQILDTAGKKDMATPKFKVESGIQLLARLRRRPDIEHFYPALFESGPKQGEIIEVYSNENASCLLMDMITEALMPTYLGGVDAGVLVFNSDGNMNFELFVNTLRRKILSRVTNTSNEQNEFTDEELHNILQNSLSNFHMLEVFDATQFYTTLHNLDNILLENPNISLVVFHTLTAFYWSEQGFKVTKMDIYLKNLLRLIQKLTKEYKITTLYTRPEYFSSSKDTIENLEACSEVPTLENVNYRVQFLYKGDCLYQVHVRTYSIIVKKAVSVIDNEIKWL